MKYKLIIDETAEEQITIIANQKREIFGQIEQLINNIDNKLIGYENEDIIINSYNFRVIKDGGVIYNTDSIPVPDFGW